MKHWYDGGWGEWGREGALDRVGLFFLFIPCVCIGVKYTIISYQLALQPFMSTLDMWGGPFALSERACMQACRQICRKEEKSALRYRYVIISSSCVGYRAATVSLRCAHGMMGKKVNQDKEA